MGQIVLVDCSPNASGNILVALAVLLILGVGEARFVPWQVSELFLTRFALFCRTHKNLRYRGSCTGRIIADIAPGMTTRLSIH